MCLRMIVAALTAAAMAACSYPVPDDTSAQDPGALDPNVVGLRIIEPADGAQISDLVSLRLQISKAAELRSNLRFQIDERPAVEYDREHGLPSTLTLDSSRYANGSHRVTVSIDTADGKTLQHSINLRFDNLPFRIAGYRVDPFAQNGAEALVDVEIEGNPDGLALSADFSSLDSAYQPGAESVETVSAGLYRIRYPVSAANLKEDGRKPVVLTARGGSGQAIVREISLPLRNTPPAPFEIKGAAFVDASAPTPQGGAPDVLKVLDAQSLNLVGDEPGAFRISWAGSSIPVERFILTVAGYAGYYILPVDPNKTEAAVEIHLPDSAPNAQPKQAALKQPLVTPLRSRSSLQPASFGSFKKAFLSFFGLGSSGSTSSGSVDVNTTPMPPSVAQVTLKWSGAADLDLHVIEPGPSGQEISYQNPVSSASGGKLSLDSNSHCTATANPAESVSWPEGTGPMSGTYKVRVTMYEGCSNDPDKKLTSAVSFSGQYTDCQGNAHPFNGTFPAGTAQNTSVDVATYDLQCPTWLHGWVSVKRVVPPATAPTSVSVPRIKIRALKLGAGDPEELASGFTDQNGVYKLAFDTKGAKFFLQTEAEINPTFAKLQVNDNSGKRQFWKSPELDPKGLPLTYNLAIADAPGATSRAGAFRVAQNVHNGIIMANVATGKDFNDCGRDDCLLRIRWEPGATTGGSKYKYSEQLIQIGPGDENSPTTPLHEFFHYVITTWSKNNSPGGGHVGEQRSEPTLAWSEGAATYYAMKIQGVATYYFGAPDGDPLDSIDLYQPIVEQGTDPADDQYGKLAEDMVTQMLFEIREKTDLVDRSIFQKIPYRFRSQAANFRTPDPKLGADFIDFIDGLRGCEGAPSDADLRTLLKGPPAGHPSATHNMPYDFVNNSKI